jgi:hypothetical protein
VTTTTRKFKHNSVSFVAPYSQVSCATLTVNLETGFHQIQQSSRCVDRAEYYRAPMRRTERGPFRDFVCGPKCGCQVEIYGHRLTLTSVSLRLRSGQFGVYDKNTNSALSNSTTRRFLYDHHRAKRCKHNETQTKETNKKALRPSGRS